MRARAWMERVALVTGASAGIGRVTAELLLREGGRVGLIARSAERLAEVAALAPANALVLPADVRDREELGRRVDEALARWGRVDLLVASAGMMTIQLGHELDEAARATLETNALGAAWAARAVLPAMRRQRFGRIVFVGSVDGQIAPVGHAAYAMSKWALRALAQSLRAELRGTGVTVSLVSPYYVRTAMLDAELGVGYTPGYTPRAALAAETVAAAILRAARSGEREIVLAPLTLRLGLALGRLLPALQEWALARAARPLLAARLRGSDS